MYKIYFYKGMDYKNMKAEDEQNMKKFKRENRLGLDEEALIIRLYEKNYDQMMGFALKTLRSTAMAEDIVQDTFYEAVRKAKLLAAHPNPGGWLMETEKYKILELRRREQRRVYQDFETCQNDFIIIEKQYNNAELNILLESALDVRERMLFRMYFLEGYSAKEIARLENVSENTLKVRMYRLKKKFLEKTNIVI